MNRYRPHLPRLSFTHGFAAIWLGYTYLWNKHAKCQVWQTPFAHWFHTPAYGWRKLAAWDGARYQPEPWQ